MPMNFNKLVASDGTLGAYTVLDTAVAAITGYVGAWLIEDENITLSGSDISVVSPISGSKNLTQPTAANQPLLTTQQNRRVADCTGDVTDMLMCESDPIGATPVDYTMALAFYIGAAPADQDGVMGSNYATPSDSRVIFRSGTNYLQFQNGSGTYVDSPDGLTLADWHWCIASYDATGNLSKISVDGGVEYSAAGADLTAMSYIAFGSDRDGAKAGSLMVRSAAIFTSDVHANAANLKTLNQWLQASVTL
jgi:hypothetical protein